MKVRAPFRRRWFLSFEKTTSIRSRSGLYGGRSEGSGKAQWGVSPRTIEAESGFSHSFGGGVLMRGKVIQDHNGAGLQFRDEHLLDRGNDGFRHPSRSWYPRT